jgi:hypothetical protein
MQYVAVAVTLLPAMVDAVAVVATVKTTVQTARWVGSWAKWAVSGPAPDKDDGAWQMVEQEANGAVVDAELKLAPYT